MSTVGVDIGGTKIMAVRLEDGEIVERAKRPTPRTGGPDDVLDTVATVVARVDPDADATTLGVGVPGPVRPGSGVLPYAANLPGWDHDVDVAAGLSGRCGYGRIVVDNDVNVGTFAEARCGAGAGVADLIGVFMGTGVGAGLILDGALRQGPRGIAGEIGHTFVAFRDLDAASAGRGELEDYAGRRMLEARARADDQHSALLDLAGDGRMKSSVWAGALAQDDPVARRLIDDATEAMAAALASAIALVDVELVVLGGGMAERLGEPFRADLEARLARRAFAATSAPVRHAILGDTGGALGAALLAEEAE